MINAIGSALSGLRAASKRLEVSANNLANQQSTRSRIDGQDVIEPYHAQRVQQVSLQGGGVRAYSVEQNPATTLIYDPNNPDANEEGLVAVPNVDTATELVEQKLATYDYKANLNSIKVQDELEQSLLDILS